MTILARHRLSFVWLLLVAATLTGFGGASLHRANGWGFAAVMLAASFKATLVARDYMELRRAPLGWKLAFAGLIGAAALVIAVLHFLAARA
jgi:hypothetical protein